MSRNRIKRLPACDRLASVIRVYNLFWRTTSLPVSNFTVYGCELLPTHLVSSTFFEEFPEIFTALLYGGAGAHRVNFRQMCLNLIIKMDRSLKRKKKSSFSSLVVLFPITGVSSFCSFYPQPASKALGSSPPPDPVLLSSKAQFAFCYCFCLHRLPSSCWDAGLVWFIFVRSRGNVGIIKVRIWLNTIV